MLYGSISITREAIAYYIPNTNERLLFMGSLIISVVFLITGIAWWLLLDRTRHIKPTEDIKSQSKKSKPKSSPKRGKT